MKQFRVYQLPVEHKAKFMGLEFVTENNIMPKLEDYKMVYQSKVWDNTTLDDIYTKYNLGEKPEGFTGHSLSVSDIVEVDGKYYYCDSYGWEEVTFQSKNTITFDVNDVPALPELSEADVQKDAKSLEMFSDFKKKHPQAILLFRCGDFYEAYEDDAKKVAEVCGTTLSEDKARVTSFPYHALDTYLPKLIRSGNKVAICDQL